MQATLSGDEWRLAVEGAAANKSREDKTSLHFTILWPTQASELLIYHNLGWLLPQQVCNTGFTTGKQIFSGEKHDVQYH